MSAVRPQVSFYAPVPDRLRYACSLLRKVYQRGTPVRVVGPMALLQRLDTLLWSEWPTEFIPHCWTHAPEVVRQVTPIVLGDLIEEDARGPVLLQLGTDLPEGWERFERVLEIIPADDLQEVQQGRQRWQRYKAQGCTPQHMLSSLSGRSA